MTIQETTPEMNRWKSWVLAVRPKTLTAAIIPVMVGTALATTVNSAIEWNLSLYALMGAIFLQIGTNLINDALDFKRGADTAKRLGPKRATQMGWLTPQQVLAGGCASFFLATLFAIPLMVQGGIPLIIVLFLSILFGYLYTGGPKPLAYSGLGDIFVLIFFGWVGTTSMYYLLTGEVSWYAILAGTEVGLLCTSLIAINNLRDREEDSTTGKNTLAVRFGETFAKIEITALLFVPYFLNLLWLSHHYNPVAMLPLLTLPLARHLVVAIWKTEPSEVYNSYLAQASLHYLLFGLLMALGFWVI